MRCVPRVNDVIEQVEDPQVPLDRVVVRLRERQTRSTMPNDLLQTRGVTANEADAD